MQPQVTKTAITVVDAETGSNTTNAGLKRTRDGKTILVPQPTDDPDDPLNWSSWKKHMVLVCVSLGAFVGDFGMSAGIPAIVLQSQEWGIAPVEANHPNNLFIVMIAVACLLWMPMANFWGRAPVFFWTTLLGLMFSLACVVTRDWHTYYAMRCLQGATQTLGQTFGLVIIHDIFFAHEHARKIGIWYAFYLVAPFSGPLFGNFMVAGLGEWRPIFWVVFSIAAIVFAMTLCVFDETRYNRSISKQPRRQRGWSHWLLRITGVWQYRHHHGYFHSVSESFWLLLAICLKPIVLIMIIVYSVIFMWCVGINQSSALLLELPQSMGGYGLSTRTIGFIYFSPIVATILGELFGHYNDHLVRRYTKRNNIFIAEIRLYTIYPMAVIMIPGLVLIGQTLEKHLHWIGIIFGWGLYQFGVMVLSVAVVAFIFDCYPDSPGEVSALVNCGRALLGFSVGYFQQDWGIKQGYDVSFGLQAVIVTICFLLIYCVQRWGEKLR